MKAGNWVLWGYEKYQIVLEYDSEYVYLAIGNDGCQLVHVSELQIIN